MATEAPTLLSPPRGTQTGSFSYFHFNPAVHTREKPYEILVNLPPRPPGWPPVRRHNQEFEDRQIAVQDARGKETDFSLDKNGFCWELWNGPTEWQGIDAERVQQLTDDEIHHSYIVEAEDFLKEELKRQDGVGVDIVKVFDYRLRRYVSSREFQSRIIDLDNGRDPLLPVTHPHIDQSENGAKLRVREHMKDRAEELLSRRYRIINIWKPLKTVQNWPLAVCDSNSVQRKDLVMNDLVRRRYIGESYYAKYNPDHQWYYLSEQQPNEVTLLKIYDSDTEATSRFSLHASFNLDFEDDGRESFEIRALVFDKPK